MDVVYAFGPESLEFVTKYRNEFIPGAPVVFIGTDKSGMSATGPDITGVVGRWDVTPTIDLALALQPDTKKVVFVAGSTPVDRNRVSQAREEMTGYGQGIEFVYLTGLTMDEMKNEVSVLEPGTVAVYLSFLLDSAGKQFSGPEAVGVLSKASSVPLYGTSQTQFGSGIVGGSITEYESIGSLAGRFGLRILGGERPATIPVTALDNVPVVDWRELDRWGLSEQRIPVGAVVRFRPPTAWEQYKWQILAIILFTILQTFLIAWLLVLRERRRKAEAESLRFAALAESEHRKLNDVVANVPGIVWESWLEPDNNRRTNRFVSHYAEKMLGYPVEDWLSTPGFLFTIVVEEDRERVATEMQQIFESGKDGILQFRWRSKDGSVFWAEAHLATIHDETGSPVGLRGVTMDVTENKIAEEKVRISEQELLEAQRLSSMGSWEWDPVSDIVTWTEEVYRIAGLDPSQPAANFEQHKELYTAESFDQLALFVARALDTGAPYELELELIRPDKELRSVNARGEVIRAGDKIVGLRGTLQDITARKQAELALAESEERYRNVVETQTELICRYRADTTLTFVNDAYCRYFGKSREELIGTRFVNLIPLHDREAALSQISSLIESQESITYEHQVILPNGTRGWQQWTDRTVATLNGHPPELQGIGRDITEKRLAEEALRTSENRFRIMADSAPVLIWMCGPDRRCTYVNQGWLNFTGRSIDRELGSGWMEGIHPDDVDRTGEIFDSAFDRQEPFRLEYRLRRADGDFRWLYDSGSPRFSSEGEFLGYIGSCVDISDRKLAEEAATRSHEEVVRLQKQLQEENVYLKEVIQLDRNFDEIIGHSDALNYVLFKIEQVAPTDATVLITGETGTGKELVARAIHNNSLRKSRPLVTVNCASLSATLIESELFGHERGAFTGAAARKIGRFELADGATLFLDEVGELPLELQPKLLRVIQEGEFERLGSSKTIKADVRIIAATNRDLEAEVKNGRFRADLLFRLNVVPISVPPLRERRDDIPKLIEHFTSRFAKKLGKNIRSISPATTRRLCEHSWPGNIRELANVIERSVINTRTENLHVADYFVPQDSGNGAGPAGTLEEIERRHITQTLELTRWKIEGPNGAARILGLNPSTLRHRLSKLGIVIDKTQRNNSVSQ